MYRFKDLRKKFGYSEEFVGKKLGITRITYHSREQGKTERKQKEIKILLDLYKSDFNTIADTLIKNNCEISVYMLEYLLEELQDLGLLSESGIAVRSNIRSRFVNGSKVFEDNYVKRKEDVVL